MENLKSATTFCRLGGRGDVRLMEDDDYEEGVKLICDSQRQANNDGMYDDTYKQGKVSHLIAFLKPEHCVTNQTRGLQHRQSVRLLGAWSKSSRLRQETFPRKMRVVEPLRRSFHWRGGDRAHDGHALHLRSCYAYLSSVPGPMVHVSVFSRSDRRRYVHELHLGHVYRAHRYPTDPCRLLPNGKRRVRG